MRPRNPLYCDTRICSPSWSRALSVFPHSHGYHLVALLVALLLLLAVLHVRHAPQPPMANAPHRAQAPSLLPRGKGQRHNITHVEIWLGDGRKTLGARWGKRWVEIHDSYEFTSKKYGPNKCVTTLPHPSVTTWCGTRGLLPGVHQGFGDQ